MERKEVTDEPMTLTGDDFHEFLSATDGEQWKILLAHAEKNREMIQTKSVEPTKNSDGRKEKGARRP